MRRWGDAPAVLLLLLIACGDDLAGPPEAAVDSCLVPVGAATIQAAVDYSVCAVVRVMPGTYDENVVIGRDLSIEGVGGGDVVIDGGGRDSVVVIENAAAVTLSGLTIQNGRAERGGGIRNNGTVPLELLACVVQASSAEWGGGIWSVDSVHLVESEVRDNTAWGGSAGGVFSLNGVRLERGSAVERNRAIDPPNGSAGGGGIVAHSVGVYEGSRVSDNRAEAGSPDGASAGGGGIIGRVIFVAGGSSVTGNLAVATASASGGGIICSGHEVEPGHVSITEGSSVAGNQASAVGRGVAAVGGGIVTKGCGLHIGSSTLSGNSAVVESEVPDGARGGGIAHDGYRFVIANSTVSGNQASGEAARGGGIALGDYPVEDVPPPVVANSTVSGNRATGGGARGGGIWSAARLGIERLEVFSSTLTDNRAAGEGGGIATEGVLAAAGSIVWGNLAPDAPDLWCAVEAESRGYNLLGDPSGCELGGEVDLDQVGVDPFLGDLVDRAGPTATHLPMAGSPAIEGGNPAGCLGPDDTLLETDQRGLPRPVGVCDVGAVEVQRGR